MTFAIALRNPQSCPVGYQCCTGTSFWRCIPSGYLCCDMGANGIGWCPVSSRCGYNNGVPWCFSDSGQTVAPETASVTVAGASTATGKSTSSETSSKSLAVTDIHEKRSMSGFWLTRVTRVQPQPGGKLWPIQGRYNRYRCLRYVLGSRSCIGSLDQIPLQQEGGSEGAGWVIKVIMGEGSYRSNRREGRVMFMFP